VKHSIVPKLQFYITFCLTLLCVLKVSVHFHFEFITLK
jgi:hypothetical protein